MSFPYTPNLKDEKVESLQTQYEFLNLLRLRHLQWMSSVHEYHDGHKLLECDEACEAQVEGAHHEIAALIEQITDRYRLLFDRLQDGSPGGPPNGKTRIW